MRETLVDIGIATWGPTKYLSAAIESVVAQSHPTWRLLISHDGPADSAARGAVEPFLDDQRIAYSARQQRVGAAGNKTWLINQGSAPFVALLDHDDLWEETFLERRLSFLADHAECGFAFASMRQIDSDGLAIKRWNLGLDQGVQERDAFVEQLLGRNIVGASAGLVRRTSYEAVGPRFDERFPRTYDYEMWLRLALAFQVGFLSGFDLLVRLHPEQGTADITDLEQEYASLVDHVWSLVREQAPSIPLSPRSRRRRLASLLLTGVLIALERDDPVSARRYLGRAMRIDPRSVLDKRAPVAMLGISLGQPGRDAVSRIRAFAHDHGARLRL